jgi:hypothetical protein
MTAFYKTYDAKASMEELLSPKDFLKLKESDRENIKSAQIVPVKLGQRNFGKIKIIRKTPVYLVTE